MATITPAYSWPVPTSTDLVTNGATAIEALGDAIDASMNTALGTKKAGMVLLNTTSFSAVSSQSINDVFSATYDNYRIILTCIGSAAGDVNFRVRVAGADNSASNYVYGGMERISSGTSFTGLASTGATSWPLLRYDTGSRGGVSQIDIFKPFEAIETSMIFGSVGENVTNQEYSWINGQLTVTTSYTGFSLIATVGNITGEVSVYGYNK
jgi:hypothetical protein